MKWEPIDTAPKDGSNILLRIDGEAIQGNWQVYDTIPDRWVPIVLDSHGCGCCGGDDSLPTHWAPLPEMPAK